MTSTAVHTPSVACTAEQHQLCDRAGFNMHLHQFQPGTCTCRCHSEEVTA